MIFILKAFILFAFAVAVASLIITIWVGILLRTDKNEALLWVHKLAAYFVIGSMLILVILVRVMVSAKNSEEPYPPIFWVHLPFAISFLTLFVGLFRFNGKKYKHHGRLAYITLATFLVMSITGGMLLVEF